MVASVAMPFLSMSVMRSASLRRRGGVVCPLSRVRLLGMKAWPS